MPILMSIFISAQTFPFDSKNKKNSAVFLKNKKTSVYNLLFNQKKYKPANRIILLLFYLLMINLHIILLVKSFLLSIILKYFKLVKLFNLDFIIF